VHLHRASRGADCERSSGFAFTSLASVLVCCAATATEEIVRALKSDSCQTALSTADRLYEKRKRNFDVIDLWSAREIMESHAESSAGVAAGEGASGARRAVTALLLVALALGGCMSASHRYMMKQPVGGSGDWKVYGGISRARPIGEKPFGDYPATPGRALADDEYRLTLEPVPTNPELWDECDAELLDPKIAAEGDTINLEWAAVVDARFDSLDAGYTESYIEYRRSKAPLSYESGVFHLPLAPPDSLLISTVLRVRWIETGETIVETSLSAWAIKDEQRRWSIRDALEL
jgi:hypothetical protein